MSARILATLRPCTGGGAALEFTVPPSSARAHPCSPATWPSGRKRGGYLTVTARVTSFFVSPGCTAPLYSSRMISLSSFEYRVGADQYWP
jgi:hypothetical protein